MPSLILMWLKIFMSSHELLNDMVQWLAHTETHVTQQIIDTRGQASRVLQGRRHCIFLDSKGLVCASRQDLQTHKQPFAHDIPYQKTLLDAVLKFQPTALIGVSTMRGAFSAQVIEVRLATLQCLIHSPNLQHFIRRLASFFSVCKPAKQHINIWLLSFATRCDCCACSQAHGICLRNG